MYGLASHVVYGLTISNGSIRITQSIFSRADQHNYMKPLLACIEKGRIDPKNGPTGEVGPWATALFYFREDLVPTPNSVTS